ncbi:MAG: amino acid permease [Erysipelotrichaceae bacterium]
MKDFKRLGYPLLIIVGSAIISKFLTLYIKASFINTLVTVVIVCALFLFGTSLNKSSRSNAVIKKVISLVLVIFLMLMQMNIFTLPYISSFLDMIGMHSFFINMLYIYCGYIFVD